MRVLSLVCVAVAVLASTACHDLELPRTKAAVPEPLRPVVGAPLEAPAAPTSLLPAAPDPVEPRVGTKAKRTIREPTDWQGDDSVPGARRAEAADRNRRAVVQEMFREAGVAFPPGELFMRVFKEESELEAWASSEKGGEMKRIATYEICRMSGDVGPKRREGDYQVPEGFYRIEYFWPDSAFYLAGKVSYPNALDRQLGGATPGGDIMLHGGCASIGCISMSDERMEELFVMGTSVAARGDKVEMHIFPTRDIRGLIERGEKPEHHAFWANLAEGMEAFESSKRVPRVTVGWKGKYDVVAKGG